MTQLLELIVQNLAQHKSIHTQKKATFSNLTIEAESH